MNFRDLKIWQKGMLLVEEIYLISRDFPSDEKFGLTSQICRAAVSIPSNISEGYGRNSNKDFLKFLAISRGSLNEVETQLEIATRLDFINKEQSAKSREIITELHKMIHTFGKSLKISDDPLL